jgi:uncharacterized RDD family membrane protein YckC
METMEEVSQLEESTELARKGARLGAQILDGILSLIIMLPIAYLLGIFEYWSNEQEPPYLLTLISGVISIAIFIAINWKLLTQNAQTFGKFVLNLKIVNIDGSKPSIQQLLFKRFSIYWGLNYVPVVGGLINTVNILLIFRKDRRCLHDHVAGTKVINS